MFDTGFAHFDSHRSENFSAALLCLVLELDPEARATVVDLFQRARREHAVISPNLGALLDVQRERRLDGEGVREYQRADLCLRFMNGALMVEVKSHTGWGAERVAYQVRAQATSAGPVAWRIPVLGSLLLAPTSLVARVRTQVPAVTWTQLIGALGSNSNPIVVRAIRHWEQCVEPTIGLQDVLFRATELDGAVQRVACLREFLTACALDLALEPEVGRLNLTGSDAQPFRHGEWSWHGLSVSLRGGAGRRIGIYRYLTTPEAEQDAKVGAWLELYTDDPDTPALATPFAPVDLAAGSLDNVRRAFVAAALRLPAASPSL